MKKYGVPVFLGLVAFSCTVFEKDEVLLANLPKSNSDKINIYYVQTGATTNDNIQVRNENDKKVLWVSEKYNCLRKSILLNDTLLQLVLTDTGYQNFNNKLDTVIIKLK